MYYTFFKLFQINIIFRPKFKLKLRAKFGGGFFLKKKMISVNSVFSIQTDFIFQVTFKININSIRNV